MASLRFKVKAHEVVCLFQRPASWEEVWLQSSERNSRSDRKPLEKRVSKQSVKEKCGGEWRLKPGTGSVRFAGYEDRSPTAMEQQWDQRRFGCHAVGCPKSFNCNTIEESPFIGRWAANQMALAILASWCSAPPGVEAGLGDFWKMAREVMSSHFQD